MTFAGDIDPNLGITHANSIAKRISSNDNVPPPQKVYASPFLRTVHTGHIIATAVHAKVRIEEGLTEWQVPSLLEVDGIRTFPKTATEHAKHFDSIDLEYRSLNPLVMTDDAHQNDAVATGSPQFPESEEKLVVRCATTLEKILENAKGDNIAIVAHAPCVIGMALHLAGMSLKQSTLDAWPLGGLTLFSRPILNKNNGKNDHESIQYGDWTMEFYGSSDHMPGEYKNGLKRWTLPSLSA